VMVVAMVAGVPSLPSSYAQSWVVVRSEHSLSPVNLSAKCLSQNWKFAPTSKCLVARPTESSAALRRLCRVGSCSNETCQRGGAVF
jgi:hypothetical protein